MRVYGCCLVRMVGEWKEGVEFRSTACTRATDSPRFRALRVNRASVRCCKNDV